MLRRGCRGAAARSGRENFQKLRFLSVLVRVLLYSFSLFMTPMTSPVESENEIYDEGADSTGFSSQLADLGEKIVSDQFDSFC